MNSQKTSVTTPKTGLAKKVRNWTSTRQTPFTIPGVCDALGALGRDRAQIRHAITDFIDRGEIETVNRSTFDVRRRTTYIYNHSWHREKKGGLKPRVIKAMYVAASAFSSADIQRISGVSDRSYVDRIIRSLKKEGHIYRIGKRYLPHVGSVQLYNILNRERFRIEVMR